MCGPVCAAFHQLQTAHFAVSCSAIRPLCRGLIAQRPPWLRTVAVGLHCTKRALTATKGVPTANVRCLVGAGAGAFNGVPRRGTTSHARSACFEQRALRRTRLSGGFRRKPTPRVCASTRALKWVLRRSTHRMCALAHMRCNVHSERKRALLTSECNERAVCSANEVSFDRWTESSKTKDRNRSYKVINGHKALSRAITTIVP